MGQQKRLMDRPKVAARIFHCSVCHLSFPTGWQLRRHYRSESHQRVARAAQMHNNNVVVVANETNLPLREAKPSSIGSSVAPQRAEAYIRYLRIPPRKFLLYGSLILTILWLVDFLSKHKADTTAKVKVGGINLIVPTGIATVVTYLALSKMARAEIQGWLEVGHRINRFFGNWIKN